MDFGKAPQNDNRWVPFRAPSGGTVPAGAVMVPSAVAAAEMVSGHAVMTVTKPTGADSWPVFVNGPTDVPAGSIGYCILAVNCPTYASYDSGDGTPAVGEEWGPQANEWTLAKDASGFRVLRAGESGRVLVTATMPGGGVSAYRITQTALWDASVSEAYVLGRPVTPADTAISSYHDTPHVVGTTKLYIPQAFGPNTRPPDLGSLHVGLRVFCQENNGRLEIVSTPGHAPGWFSVKPEPMGYAAEGVIPAYGVCQTAFNIQHVSQADGAWKGIHHHPVQRTNVSTYPSFSHYVVNGPWPLDYGTRQDAAYSPYKFYGTGTHALVVPAYVLYEPDSNGGDPPAGGDSWGPVPGSYKLHRGAPGFTGYPSPVSSILDLGEAGKAALFIQSRTGVFLAKARINWNSYSATYFVECHLAVTDGMVYDGQSGSSGWSAWTPPEVKIRVYFPSEYNTTRRIPNVEAGNFLNFVLGNGHHRSGEPRAWAAGNYYDDPLFTLRMYPSYTHASAPQGWAFADGIENSLGNGGSGYDYRDKFLVGKGGGYDGAAGGFTDDYAYEAAPAKVAGVPPWQSVYLMERIDNSDKTQD